MIQIYRYIFMFLAPLEMTLSLLVLFLLPGQPPEPDDPVPHHDQIQILTTSTTLANLLNLKKTLPHHQPAHTDPNSPHYPGQPPEPDELPPLHQLKAHAIPHCPHHPS